MTNLLFRLSIIILLGIAAIVPPMLEQRNKIWYHDQVAVLMYHHIDDQVKSGATITPALLEDQLDYLQQKGYHFINLQQFRNFMDGYPVPKNAIFVTYDDGYESFFSTAYPIHSSRNIPAVNFLITELLDKPDSSYVPYITRDQVRQLTDNSGLFDVQCHSHALHSKNVLNEGLLVARLAINGKTETEEEYSTRIRKDTVTCIDYLQQVSKESIDSYAYPFGFYDDTAIQIIGEAGFRYAFTVETGLATRQTDPYQIPRINAGGPWISPKGLHQTILKHISVVRSSEPVNLEEVLARLNGQVERLADGTVHIQYGDKQWIAKINSNKATLAGTNQTITLLRPLKLKDGHIMIHRDDLYTLLPMEMRN